LLNGKISELDIDTIYAHVSLPVFAKFGYGRSNKNKNKVTRTASGTCKNTNNIKL